MHCYKRSTSANKLAVTSASHSITACFGLKSDAYSIQSADHELLNRIHSTNHSIAPLLLAVPQPHARDAVNSAPIYEPYLYLEFPFIFDQSELITDRFSRIISGKLEASSIAFFSASNFFRKASDNTYFSFFIYFKANSLSFSLFNSLSYRPCSVHLSIYLDSWSKRSLAFDRWQFSSQSN